jgi:hypothetical protein
MARLSAGKFLCHDSSAVCIQSSKQEQAPEFMAEKSAGRKLRSARPVRQCWDSRPPPGSERGFSGFWFAAGFSNG